MICLTIFCLDKIQIQNAPSVGLCQRTWRLSTASALEDISQFKTMPRIGQTQAKTQACEQCTVVADWLSQSGSQGRGWNNVRGAVDVEVCECNFFYSAFSLPASPGFTGSASSSRACCLSLSFTSCTPQ